MFSLDRFLLAAYTEASGDSGKTPLETIEPEAASPCRMKEY
jgi:hypothetical protein